MGAPELVCFDWDGTLVDTQDNITKACIAAGIDLGYKPASQDKLTSLVGMHAEEFFPAVFGHEIDFDLFMKTYHMHYDKLPIAPLFPG